MCGLKGDHCLSRVSNPLPMPSKALITSFTTWAKPLGLLTLIFIQACVAGFKGNVSKIIQLDMKSRFQNLRTYSIVNIITGFKLILSAREDPEIAAYLKKEIKSLVSFGVQSSYWSWLNFLSDFSHISGHLKNVCRSRVL